MYTLYLVSHTHWDREWYLTFQQFRLKLVHLIDGLLDEMEASHQFRFFMLDGQTIVLDDYLHMRPEREETIRTFVRNGRIVIGPWHILPDEFLVSPEATVRNLLQGERTCRRFGPRMRVGYIPDPFGHIGQMPQILRGFGIQAAAFRRGLSDEPAELWWEAPDGSRVFVAYLRDGYDNAASLPTGNHEKFVAEVRRLRDSLAPHTATPHILLMHGTDHMEPPPDTPQAIAAAEGKLDGDHLIHATLTDYLTAVQGALLGKHIPTVLGELRSPKRHHLLPGVLSTRMWIKQRNHACETLLEKWAEPFSTWAEILACMPPEPKNAPHNGYTQAARIAHPAPILEQTWRLLMENHPHDSICGCSIDQVHNEMKVRFDQVEQIGEEITKQSLKTLAAAIDTRLNQPADESALTESALVVFNPSSFQRTDIVHATIELPPHAGAFDLLDETGTALPYQELGLGSHEIANFTLDAAGLRSIFGSIHDGRAAGMSIIDIQVRRGDAEVIIDAILDEGDRPNLKAWEAGLKEVNAALADPSVTTYRVRARSAAAARILLVAPHVPPLGWKTFTIHPRPAGKGTPARIPSLARLLFPLAKLPVVQRLASRPRRTRPPYRIENDLLTVEAQKDGTLTLTDKTTGAVYHGLNRFLDGGDCGDEYNYAPPAADRLVEARLKVVRIEGGPIQQRMTLTLDLPTPAALAPDRKSRSRERAVTRIISTVTLTRGIPRLEIHTEVENRARDHRLRVHFAAPFAAAEGWHDGHYEVVRRPVGVPVFDETWVEQPRPEVPQRAFTDVSDGQQGLMVANRGLPEVEVLKRPDGNAEIALTLLRCVGWLSRDDFSTRRGHAGPMLETPGAQMPGSWAFDYAVIPHAGGWRQAFEQAYAFDAPLRSAVTGLHAGPLTASGSFVETSPRTFLVSAVKQTADRRGWLVRGYNLGNEDIYVTLKPWQSFKRVERADLSEQKIEDLKPEADGSVILPARKHEILSVVFLP